MPIEFEQACQILEVAFAPLTCHCRCNERGTYDLSLHEKNRPDPVLSLTDLPAGRFDSIRAVSQLALEVRQHLTVENLRRRIGTTETG